MPIHPPKARLLRDIKFFEPLDAIIWCLVLLFFIGSALAGGGDLLMSILGALGIVVVMFFVGIAVEVIIDTLRDVKGLGTLVGFITNGPEALCLIVGLLAGDVLYAASTPLGSNVMNPLMLLIAAVLTRSLGRALKTSPVYTFSCILITAFVAVIFYQLPQKEYWLWIGLALSFTFFLFIKRPPEENNNGEEVGLSKAYFFPALLLLVAAGYFLDPVVSFTAENSHAPKGRIGFFVLAALTSWPEFKSSLTLFRRGNPLAAVLNITVSNITNIWLAVLGVSVFLI